MSNKTPSRKFGLITTIAMIVGIVVGSGIFFRTSAILENTGGNVVMGILVFCISALGIIFGGLTVSQYAKQDESIGGIISYCETAWGKTVAYIAGWFQTIFYYPALCAVVSWVAANYTCALFGLPNLLINGNFGFEVWILAIVYLVGASFLNTFSTKKAGIFQSISMFSKLTALFVLAVGGLFFGKPVELITNSSQFHTTSVGFFSAIVIVAFSFDGWLIAPSIAHEIKNPKKNLPLALTIAPMIITFVYLLYFIGINAFVGPENILSGVDPIVALANGLFGKYGMNIVLLFIVISVLGTLNGITMGYIRLPYTLAVRNEIPFSTQLSKISQKYDTPIISSILAVILALFWLLCHFLSIDGVALYNLTIFSGLEVDNLPIVLTYFFYMLLYVGVIVQSKKASLWKRYVFPILAIIGAGIIIYGGLTQAKFNVYLIICLIGIVAGLLIRPKNVIK